MFLKISYSCLSALEKSRQFRRNTKKQKEFNEIPLYLEYKYKLEELNNMLTVIKNKIEVFMKDIQNNNWLYMSAYYWTISPHSSNASGVFFVTSDGYLYNPNALYRVCVRPSLYLKSDIKIVSGSGTKDDAFKLEI